MAGARKNRRQVLGSAMGAAAGVALWPRPAGAQPAPRVVVLGGGFAGASCARALREADSRIAITLVEAQRTYTAPPLSNGVLGGLRELAAQQFGYGRIAAAGITVAIATATGVNPQARTVTLSTGDTLAYDRLVVAPGIALRFELAARLQRSRRRATAARVDQRRRANRIVAPPDRGDGRWRPCRDRCTGQSGALPARSVRTGEHDRPLPENQKAALQGRHSGRQRYVHHAAAFSERMEGALSQSDRMGFAVVGRQCRIDRCGEENDRDGFRHLQVRRRERHSTATGRKARDARGRRRPHRVVPDRSGDV